MSRATKFGLGVAIMSMGLSGFVSMFAKGGDGASVMVFVMLLDWLFIFPGAILVGKAIWPSDKK